MARKKTTKPVREWLGDWTVTYEWEWRGQLLQSRRHDFGIKRMVRGKETTAWMMFNRHVINNDNGAIWVDGFDPNGGFVSYRPEQIVAVRPHREKKRNDPDGNGRQPRGRPRKKS